jgi:energy-coupling factor transporter ATP-binding protein EcfA2
MKASKSLVAIIGHRNSGKSSIIRALTGVHGDRIPEIVEDRSTGKWIYVVSHSPEECPLPEKEFLSLMRAASHDRLCLGVVIALQPNKPSKRLSMEQVFVLAKPYRFTLRAFAIETPYQASSRGSNPTEIEQRIASVGINVRVLPLDAHRFAHINAAAIRNIAGWF